jgi:periplasmic protein TonB
MPDLDSEQKPSLRLWILAAVAALALHAGGGALALAHLQPGDSDETLGAAGTEFAIEMASPRVEDTDLPAGPDADASVATPALAEQKAVVKETELPKDKPTETDDPDRAVTTNDSKPPKEDDPEPAKVQTSASMESVAQEATARQTLENARESETAAAPHQGIGKDIGKLTEKWSHQLSAYLNLHKRYPQVTNPKAVKVKVNFVLDRLGHVVSVNVVQGSGEAAYDEAALSMVRRSDPLPAPPPMVADEGLSFTVDVVFQKGKS